MHVPKKLDLACLALRKVWLVAISDVFIIACVAFHTLPFRPAGRTSQRLMG